MSIRFPELRLSLSSSGSLTSLCVSSSRLTARRPRWAADPVQRRRQCSTTCSPSLRSLRSNWPAQLCVCWAAGCVYAKFHITLPVVAVAVGEALVVWPQFSKVCELDGVDLCSLFDHVPLDRLAARRRCVWPVVHELWLQRICFNELADGHVVHCLLGLLCNLVEFQGCDEVDISGVANAEQNCETDHFVNRLIVKPDLQFEVERVAVDVVLRRSVKL